MRLPRRLAFSVCVGLLGAAASGCGGGVPAEPGKAIGVYNEDPNSELKGVTIENEAGNMKLLKAKTKTAPPPRSLGPTLPGQPQN